MKLISITGGVGSGKSEVLQILGREYDAEIIIADQVAHRLMEPGADGFHQVVALFGAACLSEDGSIDRIKLAKLIFADKENVKMVDSIIHPMVWRAIEQQTAASPKPLVVVEAALFDEEHNAMFDEIWYIYATVENRITRLMNNRGYTREKCLEIMDNQAAEAEFRACSTCVIDNNGSVEQVRSQIHQLLKEE